MKLKIKDEIKFEDLKKIDFKMPKNEAIYSKNVRGEYTITVDRRPYNKIYGEIRIVDIKRVSISNLVPILELFEYKFVEKVEG